MARYIDADKLIADIQQGVKFGQLTITEIISKQPTADVRENVHGEWVPAGGGLWMCNKCGYVVEPYNNTPFCHNCGVDMRKEVDP